ncbi:MAG: TlpA disulfide reductase family protein [Bdellovibrionota bacterium]
MANGPTQKPFWKRRETWIWGMGFSFAFLLLVIFGRIPAARRGALEGNPAPNIPFVLAGSQQSLSDYAGKVVLLNFWATWCGPCMEEMPALRELEDKLAEKGFALLAFNVEGENPKLLSQIPEELLPRHLIFEFNQESLDPYGVEVIPLSVLINKSGAIERLFLGPRDWATPSMVQEIEKLL